MPTPSTPTFRSLSTIIGDMVSTFLSELDRTGIVPGIQSLKPASPYLAIFESTGQSQFRNQEQTLSLLDANDLDIAHGERLDRIGIAEKLPRRGATFATGYVDISDTSFTKVATRVYQGKAAPIPGSVTIYVADGTGFSPTGNLYIGRNTQNLEGPLAYTGIVNAGSYWTITLAAGTTNFHGLGETVTFAQGGDRVITAGQTVTTPQGNSVTYAQFNTTSAATLLDGETLIQNVPVSSKVPGAAGNASAGGVKVVSSPAFTGMAVTNTLPITNGLDVENDDLYRERIKAARRSRTGVGTVLGINVHTYGVQAPDEAATVVSSQYINRSLLPSLLVIDDGTGYEAKDAGIAYEVLMDSAIGGEDVFFLNHGQPVAKASVTTVLAAPYALTDLSTLTVQVGGVTYSHSFETADFRDITNATAYEVVASINSNPTIPYSARTTGAGTHVAIFAKANTNDDIAVIPGGANVALAFPPGTVDSIRIYKNDYLLSKDGNSASLTGADQSTWSPVASGETLIISVDGTPSTTYTFTDLDAINLGLGYVTLSIGLPLTAWAAIFNAKVPGVTCAITGTLLTFTSNLGPSARANITIDPASSLVAKGFFNPLLLTAQGRAKDFVLDRNRGQIDLSSPLVAGDQLTAGSSFTRAYVQSSVLLPLTVIPVGGADFWFTVDGDAVRVPHTLNSTHRIEQAWTATTARIFVAYDSLMATPVFSFPDVQVGDYAIWADEMWAAGPAPTTFGVMRINGVYQQAAFMCDYLNAPGAGTVFNNVAKPPFERLFFVRSSTIPQHINLPAGNYTSAQLVTAFSALTGATASVERGRLRITTNTYSVAGDIALSAQSPNALAALGFAVASAIQNDEPEAASVESGNSDVGTPRYPVGLLTTYVAPLEVLSQTMTDLAEQHDIGGGIWLRAIGTTNLVGNVASNIGTNAGDSVEWTSYVAGNVILDHLLAEPRPAIDSLAAVSRYRVGPISSLNVVFDNDPVTKGYTVPMSRWLKVDPAVPYGINLRLVDADNSNLSLAAAFGTTFDFSNFALHSRGRGRLDLSLTQPANVDTLLFRWKLWSGTGQYADVRLLPPQHASAALDVLWSAASDDTLVHLAGGADRGVTFSVGDKNYMQGAGVTATLVSAFGVAGFSRAPDLTTVTVTLTQPTADVLAHGLIAGDQVYIDSALDPDFASGVKTLTSVVAAFPGATVTYTEAGANVASAPVGAFMSRQGTATDFAAVQVGDFMAVPSNNASYWSLVSAFGELLSRSQVVAVQVASPCHWVQLQCTGNPASYGTIVQPSDITFFPLAANTTSGIVSAINALSTSPVTALLVGGPGTGVVSVAADSASLSPIAYLRDSLISISSAVYNPGVGILNYDITLKKDVEPDLAITPNDWANEEFRLVPTTAKNVADYLNRGEVTGLASTGASIKASSNGRKVQLTSGTLGSSGAVQVSGGTANAVTFPLLSTVMLNGAMTAVVSTTANLESILPLSSVMLTNSQVLPKVLNWTNLSTLTAVSGVITIGVAGSAWAESSVGLKDGPSWVWSDVGNFKVAYASDNSFLTSAGSWVRFEPGWGKWKAVGARANALVGSAYVTLPNGLTMAIGGVNHAQYAGATATSTAVEFYDPLSESWTSMPNGYSVNPADSRAWGAAVYIPAINSVLFAGGVHCTAPGTFTYHADAWLFDVATVTWAPTGALTLARSHLTLTTMSTGQVVAVGGLTNINAPSNRVEIFDSTGTLTFTATNSLNKARGDHRAFLFGIDQLLVVGGLGAALAGYETFALNSLVWSNDIPLASNLVLAGLTVVPLSSTKFLVAGGVASATIDYVNSIVQPVAKAEVYDTATGLATAVSDMVIPAAGGDGAVIPNSKVLVWGGAWGMPLVGTVQAPLPHGITQVYDTVTATWTLASSSKGAHFRAPALDVSGTTVTVAGGFPVDDVTPSTLTERFDSSMLAAPQGNVGTFRIMQAAPGNVVIEAPSAVAGEWDYAYVRSYTYDSVMPGDVLHISSNSLGTAPAGDYTVLSTDFFNPTKFTIASGTWASGALGTLLPFVQVIAESPARMLYTVLNIGPSPDVGQSHMRLDPAYFQEQFSTSAGSVLAVMDKLAFPTTLVPGQDGYRYNTGLIAEVTKVVYGDERDTVTYPGYASAGAAIDVAAPLIRRVLVSLAIRARSGSVDIKSRVQAATAKVVNSAPPGPIALSLIIEAVQQVDGIISVVLLSPVATTTADTIPVQPYEKALILDPSNDVTVSLIGA